MMIWGYNFSSEEALDELKELWKVSSSNAVVAEGFSTQ